MLVLTIDEEQVKPFMRKLLKEDAFDHFCVRGVDIAALTRFQITGEINGDFLEEGQETPPDGFCTWSMLKPYVFQIIKGDKRPKFMKFTFSMPQEQLEALHPNAAALFLNLSFEGGEVHCTTGTSEKTFTMDKTVDLAWEAYVQGFLVKLGLVVSTHDM